MVIDEDGYLWACGSNMFGQLGLGDCDSRNRFEKIKMQKEKDENKVICEGEERKERRR